MYREWLDKNCDSKWRHTGPALDNGEQFECDFWMFVIDDHCDEVPAIVVQASYDDGTNYVGLEIINNDEEGYTEGSAFLGLFENIEDITTLLALLVKANRQ